MSSKDEKERGGGKTFANYSGQTFQQINGDLKTNPNKVPKDLQEAWAKSCGDVGFETTTTQSSSSSGGGGPTTTKG